VNVLWGIFNVLVGGLLLLRHPIDAGDNLNFLLQLAGALTIGIYLAIHFGDVHKDSTTD
jgi:hypothetical protein